MSQTLDVTNTETKWLPYPKYKSSGVEWLGEIPEHWEVKRLKYVVQMNPDTLPEDTDANFELKYVDISNVDAHGTILNAEALTFGKAPSRARRRVQNTDTIISTVRTYLKAIAFIDNQPGNLIVSTGFAVLRPYMEVHPKFLWLLIQSKGFVDTVVVYSQGIGYPAISPSSLASLLVCLPPLPEQRAIAAFLDRETASINALIAKKQQLITLLRERRTALISHAVTKGLDTTVPMKNSGVAWLGEIPKHWYALPLKRFARIRYGLGQPPLEMKDGVPLIRATNVKSGCIMDEGMLYVDPKDVPQSRDATLSSGEIIVVRSGAYTGDSSIIPTKYNGSIAGYDMVVTVKNANNSFVAWQILTHEVRDLQFGFHKLRAAQPHLNAEELGETLLVFPPLSEQQAIVAYLDKETTRIDALIARIEDGIKKLQEYSIALISAAVTGKIDVRNSAKTT